MSLTFGRSASPAGVSDTSRGRPRQEPDPEILLELAHPVAERRLRQVEMRGRELEAAALGDGDEGVQAEKVDPHRAGHPVEARPCMQEIHQKLKTNHLLHLSAFPH